MEFFTRCAGGASISRHPNGSGGFGGVGDCGIFAGSRGSGGLGLGTVGRSSGRGFGFGRSVMSESSIGRVAGDAARQEPERQAQVRHAERHAPGRLR